MKKFFIYFLITIIIASIWVGESRKFYCLPNGQCLTVWKTYNNTCYLVPGKYYGPLAPKKGFIKTSNSNSLIFFITSNAPNILVFKSGLKFEMIEDEASVVKFVDYYSDEAEYTNVFFKKYHKTIKDVKPETSIIMVMIEDNYALDKNGNKM